VSERQQILVPGIHFADTVICRSCATLALLQTDSEADPRLRSRRLELAQCQRRERPRLAALAT
jgi:hypothetical protein